MKSIVFSFFNPINWYRAWRFHRSNAAFDKSTYDLELYLYSKILKNDMLHYGYFEAIDIEPETISLKQLEDAQVHYAENIIDQITDNKGTILDVGCGMGGLSALLLEKNFTVEALTPNTNQFQHFSHKYPGLVCHHKKMEDFRSDKKYSTVINSESLQYIKLEDAFHNVEKLLLPGGRWIITDYFRIDGQTVNRSGHLLPDFLEKLQAAGWKIVVQKDITANVLPTLKFVNMYVERFLLPVKHFAFEKLRYKKAWLYYLTEKLRTAATNKMEKELTAIDPERFAREKKYMLFVLERSN